jgi:hypothetical protein
LFTSGTAVNRSNRPPCDALEVRRESTKYGNSLQPYYGTLPHDDVNFARCDAGFA